MIPLKLALKGFLSYKNEVEVDFTDVDLACISGQNGAGKSSLLDAMTWALFGKARQSGDGVITNSKGVDEAVVALTFEYEGNIYKATRRRRRGKSTVLEFHILADPPDTWKQLTGSSVRETQHFIEETLRMDYDTFIHASFFLQGEADNFTQERPARRKEVLASILGLEQWEEYRQRAVEHRKAVETQIASLDQRMQEIRDEMAHEAELKTYEGELQDDIKRLNKEAEDKEKLLREYERRAASIRRQEEFLEELRRQVENHRRRADELRTLLESRRTEIAEKEELLRRADELRTARSRWEQVRADLAKLEKLQARHRSLLEKREPFLEQINQERGRLLQEQKALQRRQNEIAAMRRKYEELQERIRELSAEKARKAAALEEALKAQERAAALRAQLAELGSLRSQAHKEGELRRNWQEQLENPGLARCPLCGSPLEGEHREEVKARVEKELEELRAKVAEYNRQIKELTEEFNEATRTAQKAEKLQRAFQAAAERLKALETEAALLRTEIEQWETKDEPRLKAVLAALENENFAPEARSALQKLDAEIQALGYDAEAHAKAQEQEKRLSEAVKQLGEIERAEAALVPLRREAAEAEKRLKEAEAELAPLEKRYTEAAADLAAEKAQAPDVDAAERELVDLRRRIGELNTELGGVRQHLHTIARYREELKNYEAERGNLARTVARYKMLEEAFGKNGIPTLLIEQSLPVLEEEANSLLERLTDGEMRVAFRTQRPYKDSKRSDLKETLDILVYDSHGERDYESYSGGEAFRVDFAVRVALARLLAHRAGARLQTLVIDEGFGSQDADGRARLVEAIQAIRNEFAKILVITHIESLKDQFPTRIEVTKTPEGSRVEIIHQ